MAVNPDGGRMRLLIIVEDDDRAARYLVRKSFRKRARGRSCQGRQDWACPRLRGHLRRPDRDWNSCSRSAGIRNAAKCGNDFANGLLTLMALIGDSPQMDGLALVRRVRERGTVALVL